MQWEYIEIITDCSGIVKIENGVATTIFKNRFMFPTCANAMGSDGWELVVAISNPENHTISYVFKRPVVGLCG